MRTTVDIDDELLAHAMQLTGIKKKKDVLHQGLEKLVEDLEYQKAAEALIALGGTMPDYEVAPRRKYEAFQTAPLGAPLDE